MKIPRSKFWQTQAETSAQVILQLDANRDLSGTVFSGPIFRQRCLVTIMHVGKVMNIFAVKKAKRETPLIFAAAIYLIRHWVKIHHNDSRK